MTETELKSSVRVRDLISVFESKTNEFFRVEYSRPRAKSLGNILAKNVVVKTNEVTTLEGVEKALDDFKEGLGQNNVYNKQKHVELQTQLFNILTSIGNVRSDAEEDITKKKTLTTTTLSLVSSLNQILPSNNPSSELNVNENISNGTIHKKNEGNDQKHEHAEFEPSAKQILLAPELPTSNESEVSVKKLREHFQASNNEVTLSVHHVSTSNHEEEYLTEYSLTLKQVSSYNETDTPDSVLESKYSEKNEREKDVSVSKLKMLYEKKSEEISRGLQVIFNDDVSHHRFRYKVDIPYLEMQNKDNLISSETERQGDFDKDDQSLTDSSYITAYNSINEFDGELVSETDSETSSSRSAESVRELQLQ